jgi:hypothetical protein
MYIGGKANRLNLPRHDKNFPCLVHRWPPSQSILINFPTYKFHINSIISPSSDVRIVLADCHAVPSEDVVWCRSGCIHHACPLDSVCQRCQPFRHVNLAPYVGETPNIVTSLTPTLLVSYFEKNSLHSTMNERLQNRNEVSKSMAKIFARVEWRIIQCIHITCYLG